MPSGFITIVINKIIACISHGIHSFQLLDAAISKRSGIHQCSSDEHPGLDWHEKKIVSVAVIENSEGNKKESKIRLLTERQSKNFAEDCSSVNTDRFIAVHVNLNVMLCLPNGLRKLL